MSEPIGQGLHHYVLPKDGPVAALNILRVIAEGRCEQPRTTKPRRTWFAKKRGRPGYWQAGIHELQLAPIDDGALGVMTIAARRAILLSEDGVYRHRLAIEAWLMRAAG
jgi:hypothetical protein